MTSQSMVKVTLRLEEFLVIVIINHVVLLFSVPNGREAFGVDFLFRYYIWSETASLRIQNQFIAYSLGGDALRGWLPTLFNKIEKYIV